MEKSKYRVLSLKLVLNPAGRDWLFSGRDFIFGTGFDFPNRDGIFKKIRDGTGFSGFKIFEK